MKKWKILNDSDKQSQNSSNTQKYDNNISNMQNKAHRYVPLKRTKDNSILNNSLHSKNIQSNKELYLPIFTHRYVKSGVGSSVGSVKSRDKDKDRDRDKFKTECYGDEELEFGGKNFQEIQQNFRKNLGGNRLSDRGGSMVLKSKEQDNTIISHHQTQRKIFLPTPKNQQVDEFERYRQNFKKKQIKNQGGLKNIRQSLRVLSNKQIQLKQEVQTELNNFLRLMNQSGLKITEKVLSETQKSNKNQVIQKILAQYKTYKPKIDELETQKQVLLQSLIKMAPV